MDDRSVRIGDVFEFTHDSETDERPFDDTGAHINVCVTMHLGSLEELL